MHAVYDPPKEFIEDRKMPNLARHGAFPAYRILPGPYAVDEKFVVDFKSCYVDHTRAALAGAAQ